MYLERPCAWRKISVLIAPGCSEYAATPLPVNRRANSIVNKMSHNFELKYVPYWPVNLFKWPRSSLAKRAPAELTITTRLGADFFNNPSNAIQ